MKVRRKIDRAEKDSVVEDCDGIKREQVRAETDEQTREDKGVAVHTEMQKKEEREPK